MRKFHSMDIIKNKQKSFEMLPLQIKGILGGEDD